MVEGSMTRSWRSVLAGSFVVCVFTLILASENVKTLHGTLYDTSEDVYGDVTSIALVVENEGAYHYYYVVIDSKGKELLTLAGEEVTVTGLIEKHKDDSNWFRVRSWKVENTSDQKLETGGNDEEM